MPATTPNRSYPYPVPTDPVDVPGDIQRLAEAVNDDVQANLVPVVGPRVMAKMRGSTPQTFPAGPIARVLFDITRIDTDNMTDPVNQPGIFTVNTDGFYVCQFTALVPANVGWNSVRFSIAKNGSTLHSARREFRGTGYAAFTFSGGTILPFVEGDTMELFLGVGNTNTTLPADRELTMFRTGPE